MPSRAVDPEGYARQRAYHKRRSVMKKMKTWDQRPTYTAHRLEQLWDLMDELSYKVQAHAAEGSDPDLLSHAATLRDVILELKLRGTQGRLFDDQGEAT